MTGECLTFGHKHLIPFCSLDHAFSNYDERKTNEMHYQYKPYICSYMFQRCRSAIFRELKVKVKQSRYRPEQAQRVDTGITLSFRDLGARRG
jgi:hypothetical protein